MLIDSGPSSKKDTGDVVSQSSGTGLSVLCHQQQQAKNQRLLNLRKIKSRNAARTRRGKENYEFYELAKLLPIPTESATQLDKASIIRLTMCFLQIRDLYSCCAPEWKMAHNGPPPNRTVKDTSSNCALQQAAVTEIVEQRLGTHILQSLDGFMFVLNPHGRIVYVSETVSLFLGLSQVEMIGSSIFDYTSTDDTNELAVNLGLTLSAHHNQEDENKMTNDNVEQNCGRSFFIRMKSALAKRGIGQKSSSFRVVHMTTHAQQHVFKGSGKGFTRLQEENLNSSMMISTGIVAFGKILPAHYISDLPLHDNVFVMRVNPSLQITYCETMIEKYLGYTVQELLGQSLYKCIHAADIKKMKNCHVDLIAKGHVETPYLRWLHNFGGFRWIYSTAMLMPNQKLYPERSFIWIHTVISDVNDDESLIDHHQLNMEKVNASEILCNTDIVPGADSSVKKQEKECNKLVKDVNESCEEGNQNKNSDGSSIIEDADLISDATPSLTRRPEAVMEKLSRDNETCIRAVKEHPKNLEPSFCDVSTTESDDEIPSKKSRTNDEEKVDKTHTAKEQIPRNVSCDSKYDTRLKIYCVRSRLAEQLNQPSSLHYADFISEYMDIDSTYWSNPPNKEISNHNDLPAGIKEMRGHLSVQHTPSAVHHHYPFGINPTLLHSNPLLSKFMTAGWGKIHTIPATKAFMLTTPVQMVPSYHIPKLCEGSKLSFEPNTTPIMHTPASVTAVLEELKKDPLHKVNPPNKVVLPYLQEPGIESITERSKNPLHTMSYSDLHHTQQGISKEDITKSNSGGVGLEANALVPQTASMEETLSSSVNAPALMHVPSTLLVSGNSMLLSSSETSLIDFNSSSTLRLPIVSASFPQRLNPCMMQALAFPQIAKVHSIPF